MIQSFVKKLQSQDWLPQLNEPRKRGGSLEKLSTGDMLLFGAMEQAELSHRKVVTGEPTQLHFASTQLTSYPLFDQEFNALCSLIVAQVKGRKPYLALSKKIERLRISEICMAEDVEHLAQGEYPKHLYIRKHTANLQEWLHLHYINKIRDAKGTKILPDEDVKSFSYSLFIAQEQYKAIELERHIDGSFDLYATIFRPCSDIVDIRHAPKSFVAKQPAMTSAPVEASAKPNQTNEIEAEQSVVAESSPEAANASSAKIFTLPTARPAGASAITEQASTITPAPSEQEWQTISCNLRMASKLIDEAMSNDMRVTDVIRKALGLRVAEADNVQFDLKLTDKDYIILADRFNVHPHDRETIHTLIMEELGYFTGETL